MLFLLPAEILEIILNCVMQLYLDDYRDVTIDAAEIRGYL